MSTETGLAVILTDPVPPRPDTCFRRSETYACSCMLLAGYWDGVMVQRNVITAGQGLVRITSNDPVPPRPTPSRTGWSLPPNLTPSRPPSLTGGTGSGWGAEAGVKRSTNSDLERDAVADTRQPR